MEIEPAIHGELWAELTGTSYFCSADCSHVQQDLDTVRSYIGPN